ncbi:hypothetical protein ILYODFUR_030926 [Ilyodon furcidens]|uniref:Uncharacterized protein n=1 Tax=Ilyodon furcidens TaxID=33524 RepID=A0ABV0TGC6_9TELE
MRFCCSAFATGFASVMIMKQTSNLWLMRLIQPKFFQFLMYVTFKADEVNFSSKALRLYRLARERLKFSDLHIEHPYVLSEMVKISGSWRCSNEKNLILFN